MKIGIDFDETLCDWSPILSSEVERRWSMDLAAVRAAGREMHEHVGEEPWRALMLELLETDLALAMPVKPGALEVTRALAERHDLVVLTARYDRECRFVLPWLQANGIPIERCYWTDRGPKDAYARELDLRVHLDDTVSVFDSFVGHPTAGALLEGSFFKAGESPLGDHVRSVESWRAFHEYVRELDEGATPALPELVLPELAQVLEGVAEGSR